MIESSRETPGSVLVQLGELAGTARTVLLGGEAGIGLDARVDLFRPGGRATVR